ncbi:MAG: non-canonical purine NTP pyrophosphatase [Verrucomicrobiota bacterium]|jgi:XTP/dITP diphosphohydrolase
MPSRTPPHRPVLWIATANPGKTREFKELFGARFLVRDLHSFKNLPVIHETGRTFEANAKIKALALSRILPGQLILADDSGLVVPALGGRPGVRSARFSGPNATNESNRIKLLRVMRKSKNAARRAYFEATLVLAKNGEVFGVKRGRVWGRITHRDYGSGGFGYDPIFIPKSFARTFGQLSPRTKGRISHRAQAVRGLMRLLSKIRHKL